MATSQEGNVSFKQIRKTHRHGDGVQAQASDGTGLAGHYGAFAEDGSLTDGGGIPLVVGGSAGGVGKGQLYMQIPNGALNGANVDFYLDFIPTSPPTGSPAKVPFWLYINGSWQSPYVPRYTLAAGSNHLVMAVPPPSNAEMACLYFTGEAGATPGQSTPTGTATINIWSAYVDAQGNNTAHGSAGLQYSLDAHATDWQNPVGPLPASLYSEQFSTLTIPAPTDLTKFQLMAYCNGSTFANAVRDEFRIFDISVTIHYANGTTQTIKPTSYSLTDNGTGGSVTPQLAYDADANPPATYGAVYRTLFSGVSTSDWLIFTGWQ